MTSRGSDYTCAVTILTMCDFTGCSVPDIWLRYASRNTRMRMRACRRALDHEHASRLPDDRRTGRRGQRQQLYVPRQSVRRRARRPGEQRRRSRPHPLQLLHRCVTRCLRMRTAHTALSHWLYVIRIIGSSFGTSLCWLLYIQCNTNEYRLLEHYTLVYVF